MSDLSIWVIIIVVGAGTYFMRYSFLGVLGRRQMPAWALRMLRYTAVAVLPALVAPAVLWPPATGGQTDPARLLAGGATLLAGLLTRNTLAAIVAGGVTLYAMLYVLG
ncbi:AzlD domain-containing protein [Paracoccus pacificus]|uniref:AzlD domain-containing protein n=1 Tax=Paracoccus pacificus TaxID=1463598 RepID=A0ABW4RB38_9RHOB